jgi:hypothetical protein
MPDHEPSIMDWWRKAKLDTPTPLRKGLASATLLIPWMTWKHRNSCVFEGAQPSIPNLLPKIKEEVNSWTKVCQRATSSPAIHLGYELMYENICN